MSRLKQFLYFMSLPLYLHAAAISAGEHSAVLDWSGRSVITIPVDGLVVSVKVSPGERISKGDVLFELAPPTFKLKLQKAEASVEAAEPAYRDALREKKDADALYEQTVLSEVELQKAYIAYEQAAAKLKQAKADLGLAKWALGWTTVKSPADAVVIASDVSPGQMIAGDNRSTPLMRLAESGAMDAVADIALSDIDKLVVGDAVKVEAGGKTHTAKIVSLSRHAENYRLRARFRTGDAAIERAGIKATIITP